MGYTHYATLARPITAAEVGALAEDIESIIDQSGVPVAYEYDATFESPQLNAEGIHYNGLDDDGHETFAIYPGDTGFMFWKTARKPYDVVVTASLLALQDHLKGDVKISSDGDAADWAAGYNLALRALGRLVPSPLQVLDDGE